MIDGEGSIDARGRSHRLQITNTQPSIIEACQDAMDMLGVEHRLYLIPFKQRSTRPCWNVNVFKRAAQIKLFSQVRPQSIAKQKRIDFLLSLPFRGSVFDEQKVRELYESGRSLREVAAEFGYVLDDRKGATNLRSFMIRNNIPRRSRTGAQLARYRSNA